VAGSGRQQTGVLDGGGGATHPDRSVGHDAELTAIRAPPEIVQALRAAGVLHDPQSDIPDCYA